MTNAHSLAGWTIAWDLDGTLVDSAPDLVRALNLVLAEEGLPPAPIQEARDFVGHGAKALINRAMAHAGHPGFSEEQLDALTERFVAHYAVDIASDTRFFPGILDAIEDLAAHGAIHAVCTNKRTSLSVQLLEALGEAHRFAVIFGADSASRKKPDPAHLFEAVAAANGSPEKTIMIGDSRTDSGAARGAGAPFILVSFGYPAEALEGIPHDVLAHSAQDIAAACFRFAAATK
jgi:phosphoglycolate phosphatase